MALWASGAPWSPGVAVTPLSKRKLTHYSLNNYYYIYSYMPAKPTENNQPFYLLTQYNENRLGHLYIVTIVH